MIEYEERSVKTNRGLVVIATGEYNQFIPELAESARLNFKCHLYLLTDRPEDYKEGYFGITVIKIPHYGWPKMPLLRFETILKFREVYQEHYMFVADAEARFERPISNSILSHRVGVLHRNITRWRSEFNYETRLASTAYVAPDEGEKYFACGFFGGHQSEFYQMLSAVAQNIRRDLWNGIRAVWGDESHLNRYFIDHPPTLVLPPNYMCPEKNPYFRPYITHRDKDFKKINLDDTDSYLNIDPKDYEL